MPYPKAKFAAYQKALRKTKKDAFFADKSCLFCGSTHKLGLFYAGPLPAPDMSTIWDWQRQRRANTLEHCLVLCQPHQRGLISRQAMWWRALPPHGLYRAYVHNCRCDLCVECRRQYIYYYRQMRYQLRKSYGIVIPLSTPDPYRNSPLSLGVE